MTTIRTATAGDLERVLALHEQAFNPPASTRAFREARFEPDIVRVAETDGTITGTVRLLDFGHWYGGRPVRAVGVSGVAVAAEARGTGIGTALMEHALREARGSGVAISSLYPATTPLYRSMGYGYGGVRTTWRARLADLPEDRSSRVEVFDDAHLAEVASSYDAFAASQNGLLARDEDWWHKRVLTSVPDEPVYRYLVRDGGTVTGWIVYSLASRRDDWRFRLQCRDLYWATEEAARALMTTARLHRSTAGDIEWTGPVVEPLSDLTAEETAENTESFRYMVRLLDVPAALEARGYNPTIAAEVSINVADEMFDDNAGPWLISIRDGAAKVSPTDRADAVADVQTWASIYTGLHDASTAARMGALTATDDARATLDAIFAGPTPWIADFY